MDSLKEVKRSIAEFRQDACVEKKESTLDDVPVILSSHKLYPHRFIKGEWYKCSSGHYFSKAESSRVDGTSVKSIVCPVCTENDGAEPKTESATGCTDEPVVKD